MKTLKHLLVRLLFLMAVLPSVSRADDIDLYMINPALSDERPNVLIFVDNTSNWSTYFANEMNALSSVLTGLSNQFNVGIMMFTKANDTTTGGYVRAAIRQMSSTNRSLYSSMVTSLDSNSDQSNSTTPYGRAMMEAWAYFTAGSAIGGSGAASRDYPNNTSRTTADASVHALSGNALASSGSTSYLNSFLVDNCQKNFIIFISNGHPSVQEKNDSVPGAQLTSAGGNPSAVVISSSLNWNTMDDWAQFMATHTVSGKPHIYTYTIAVDPTSWPNGTRDDTVSLLESTATQGKGVYYAVTNDASSITSALNDVFQRILSINSVFASVTLPVNANVNGQYLNQVYMGVFRPDAGASPRWPGNLKLYKMQVDSNGKAQMVDSSTTPKAVYDATSGFIANNVTSFWTTANTNNITQLVSAGPPASYRYGSYEFWNSSYYPDAQGSGVAPKGTRDGVADAPDGEVVEKGGAAQRLRGAYSYNANTGTARVPNRNLYTCTGTGCGTTGTALSSMPFSTGNAAITASALGLSDTATITSLTRSGSTCSQTPSPGTCTSVVTAVTTDAHGFGNQSSVTISGAADSSFNGAVVITVTGTNSFTYTIAETPVPVATGTMSVTINSSSTSITGISYSDSGSTRTVTLTAPGHSLTVGSSATVNIVGISPSSYGGSQTVTAASSSTLTYTVALTTSTTETPAAGTTTYSSPYPTATFYNSSACTGATAGSMNIGSVTRNSGSSTLSVTSSGSSVKTPNNTYTYVKLSGTSYDACYACSSSDTTNCKKNSSNALTLTGASYTSSSTTSPAAPTLSAGANFSSSSTTKSITSLTRGGSNCSSNPCTATVTAQVASTSGISAGSTVSISGASPSDYTGTSISVLSVPDSTHFTYSISTSPSRSTTGGTASSTTSGISKDNLINWVRGQNVKNEDNPSELTSDVRGYLHGDVLHSQPAIINYNRPSVTDDIVVYYGANDGILHAIKGGRGANDSTSGDATDGNEKWGFVAPDHFSYFQRMYANSPLWSSTTPRTYFFDGPITTLLKTVSCTSGSTSVACIDHSVDGAAAYIYAGMRRGGRSYYAFDVTDPDTPKFQWKITGGSGSFSELGYTWSAAQVGKVKLSSGDKDVVIFGGGYDASRNTSGAIADDAFPQGTATMGRAIYVVDALTGALIWSASPAASSGTNKQVTGMTCSIPADIFLVDSDNDGYTDRLYAEDTCGNVWRANIGDVDTANWAVAKLFSLGPSTGNPRKFLFTPSLVRETNYDILLLGSGDREHPFDLTTANRFYALWDNQGKNVLPTTPATESDLCDFTTLTLDQTTGQPTCNCSWPTQKGWMIKFDSCAGEKVVNGAVTLNGVTKFSTNVPPGSSCLSNVNANQCSNGLGEARDYSIYYDAAYCGKPYYDTNSNGVIEANDRFSSNPAGGFPPTGTVVQTTDDNGVAIPATICSGPQCDTPGGGISTRRHRVYWQMGIDNK